MVTAITNDLLRSCIQLDVGSVERLDERKRVMPLKRVTHLVFSFKDLRTIDHLDGLDYLEKLHLDNNNICKIENLSHLVNLTTLDLSFNKIQKIEALEALKNLDDLSLYCNQIKHLEGLDTLQKLTSLSLGKNLLQSLDEILYLRRLKNLQLLTMDGNPLCKLTAAREQYQDEMLEVKQKEADEDVVVKAAQAKAVQQELFKEANLTLVDALFDSMLSEDSEYLKMKEVPSLLEALDEYRQKNDSNNEEVTGLILEQHGKKKEEIAAWKQAIKVLLDERDRDSLSALDSFNKLKKKLIHDKDLMNNCIQASHDSHTLKIDMSEDQTLSNEEKMHKAITETFQQEEIRRNRDRVEEILFVVNKNEEEINDKLSLYVESP